MTKLHSIMVYDVTELLRKGDNVIYGDAGQLGFYNEVFGHGRVAVRVGALSATARA